MGYDLHITRKKSWEDDEGPEITLEEWHALIREDPELSIHPEYGPNCARWSGASKYPDPWIDFAEGELYSKNPDGPLIEKMLQIARVLAATAQGDDGEIYETYSEEGRSSFYYEVEAEGEGDMEGPHLLPWWRRLFAR
jgi:hypothetical protein